MTVTAFPPTVSPAEEIKGRSLWSDAWRRLLHNKAAVVSIVLLLLITLASIFGPLFSPFAYDDVSWDSISIPPDFASGHYFGTDDNGRDLFVRVMYGGRISLTVGIVATLVSLFIGVIWGATAGFIGGRIDGVMMRLVDILYSVPFIFFVIMLTVVFGRNIVLIYVAIGAVSWLDMARIVRGQTMSLKKREFVEAAHAGGVSDGDGDPPPHHPQLPRPGDRLRHPDRAQCDPARILPQLPRPRRAGAADELGRADQRRGAADGELALGADLPGGLPGGDAGLLQLHRRRAARRPRPQGPLSRCRPSSTFAIWRSASPRPTAMVEAANKVSFSVEPGETLGIVGESGSGKSQVFMAVMGLLASNGRATGSVKFQGEEILGRKPGELNKIRGARMSMIFQDPMTSLNPYLTIERQLTEVLVTHRGMSSKRGAPGGGRHAGAGADPRGGPAHLATIPSNSPAACASAP